MSYDRLPDAIMNEYQATTLRKLSIEAYQPKLFAENLTSREAAKRIEDLKCGRPRGVHEGGRNIAAVPQFPPNIQLLENEMVTLKRLGAAALLSTLVALPALAQDARRDREDRVERPAGPVDATVGAAAGIAGAAVGTAGAIATAPFRDPNAAPDSCPPGASFTGPDGAQHPCR